MVSSYRYCEVCYCIGLREQFVKAEGHICCPNCGEEDDIFDYRRFRCVECGLEGDQTKMFPEFASDEDPVKDQLSFVCPDCQSSKFEQLLVTVNPPGDHNE